jgi:hypothetical protein
LTIDDSPPSLGVRIVIAGVLLLSQPRLAFPLYLVLAHILLHLPSPLASALVAISAAILAIYSALFAAWYRFF